MVSDKKDELPTEIDPVTDTGEAASGGRFSLTDMIGAGIDNMVSGMEPSLAGKRIGAYKVVRVIGRGGMGAVFLAERDDDQYKQQVAIKVVSDIALSPEVLSRFISERQILATLEHPYIAHLIDGGETDEGVPYLVMEYIEGEPIMDACHSLGFSVDQRLDLFLKICEAVQFAHQKLVVHRDLKPGNILVSSDGFPKLLDFGIAKILDPMQFDQTLIQTQDGQRLMTPEHAAPEQVMGQQVTTATDVYCLGILLYQMLTGSKPYTLQGTRRGELEKIICEQPSPAPSSMITKTERENRTEILPLAPERLRRRLRGDLDNIILKALRKEPERRYVSVNEFAEDIRRHRRGLPVSARPDTWTYRSSKFIQRHAFGVGTGVALIALLSAFAVNTSLQNARIERERQAAVQVSSFLVDLFRSVDPGEARGEEVLVKSLVDQASERIDRDLAGQPGVQSTLMNTIGVVYHHLANYDEADPLLQEALTLRKDIDDDPEARVRFHNDLGDNRIELARYDDAAELFRQALATGRNSLGEDHHEIARAMTGLGTALMELMDYEAAEPLFRDALAMDRRLLAADDPGLGDALTGYATILWRRNRLDDARVVFEEALSLRRALLGNDHFKTVEAVNNLGGVLVDAGNYPAAETLFREAVAMNERVLGPDAAVVAINLNNLGYALLATGRFKEAEPVYRRALAIERRELGNDHPELAYSLNSLAQTLTMTGELVESEALFGEALQLMQQQDDFEHRLTGQVLANYALLLLRMERDSDAYERAALAKKTIDAAYPEGHWRRAFAASVLGETLLAVGRSDEARPLLQESVVPIEENMGVDSIYARDARRRVAMLDGVGQ